MKAINIYRPIFIKAFGDSDLTETFKKKGAAHTCAVSHNKLGA